jgi:hypothetical protein|tara:strand:- start:202 stop:318 length:117 start_codon:yes stop_codon:yes gene_type:complete
MAQLIIEGNVLTIAVFETFRKYGYDGTTITLLSKVAGL